MNLWAILPVKSLSTSKSRLAPVLSPSERADLIRRLYLQTLHTVQSVAGISAVLVVSQDEEVLGLARTHGAHPLRERTEEQREPLAQLNHALGQGIAWARAQGAEEVLILPVDLPRLRPQNITELLAQMPGEPGIVLAPSWDGGTGALLLKPPDVIPPAFGPESAMRHVDLAHAARLTIRIFRNAALSLDLDTPADWRKWECARRCILVNGCSPPTNPP